jgi:hypothetical protein
MFGLVFSAKAVTAHSGIWGERPELGGIEKKSPLFSPVALSSFFITRSFLDSGPALNSE